MVCLPIVLWSLGELALVPSTRGELPVPGSDPPVTVLPGRNPGALAQPLDPLHQEPWLKVPGNKYPRRHTVFLNFGGATLQHGADISAENKSILARPGVYPAFTGSEATAASTLQAVQSIMAPYGVRVTDQRPSATVPYTMVMVGGSLANINELEPAAGIGPGADCEARGQRHVVYVFAGSGWTSTRIAEVAAHEVGHVWGLDHTVNCDSVMSYCGSGTAQAYSDTCDALCEEACQGPGTIGCAPIHAQYCGADSQAQNDAAELRFLFGDGQPDLVPPTVEIVEPEDGLEVPDQTIVHFRARVDDNYGGVGLRYRIERDGEVVDEAVLYDPQEFTDEEGLFWVKLALRTGVYELSLEAEDHADQRTRDSVIVYVGEVEIPSGSEDSSRRESDPSDASAGPSEESDSLDSGDSPDPGPGCACSARSDQAPEPPWTGLGWMLAGPLAWWLSARKPRIARRLTQRARSITFLLPRPGRGVHGERIAK